MDIMSGTYYWPATFPSPPSYPRLEVDLECDVLIVGGGSSAAQCAYYLANSGLKVTVIEKGKIGSGSTSSNTALIQYSGEKMFTNLINSFGKEYISRHLQLLQEAINEIEAASKAAAINCEFSRRDSLYSASCSEDVDRLKKEYDFLQQQGLKVDFLLKVRLRRNILSAGMRPSIPMMMVS
jgi:glycine/D-amino acid oxidase-like deaminating enzyme